VRFVANAWSARTSKSPCDPRANMSAGIPSIGADTTPSFATILMRPGRSPTSMRPSGRKLRQNAAENPSATVSTSYAAVFIAFGERVWPGHSGIGA
jgi:hypothetical protein